MIITKVWPGIVRNIHRTYSNQNRSNGRPKSRIVRNPCRIAHLVELHKQISYLLFIVMNNVTLVLVIVCTEEMEIYCSTKYLHMTVIMILLEKNLYLVGKRSS